MFWISENFKIISAEKMKTLNLMLSMMMLMMMVLNLKVISETVFMKFTDSPPNDCDVMKMADDEAELVSALNKESEKFWFLMILMIWDFFSMFDDERRRDMQYKIDTLIEKSN